jgi:hypothetical protein
VGVHARKYLMAEANKSDIAQLFGAKDKPLKDDDVNTLRGYICAIFPESMLSTHICTLH